MADEDPKYYAVLTEVGAKLEARALAEERAVVLSHIVLGDANLADVVPQADVESLVHEVCRRPIEYKSVDLEDPNVTLLHAIVPADIGGFWVRELGVVGKLEPADGEVEAENPEVLYAYANHAPYYKMLPQDGQTVTHEITVPILQSTDARLTIVVADQGYVTRPELETMRSWLEDRMGNSTATAHAVSSLAREVLRLSNRVADIEVGHVDGRFASQSIGGSGGAAMSPAGSQFGEATVAPVSLVREGETAPAGAAVVIRLEEVGGENSTPEEPLPEEPEPEAVEKEEA